MRLLLCSTHSPRGEKSWVKEPWPPQGAVGAGANDARKNSGSVGEFAPPRTTEEAAKLLPSFAALAELASPGPAALPQPTLQEDGSLNQRPAPAQRLVSVSAAATAVAAAEVAASAAAPRRPRSPDFGPGLERAAGAVARCHAIPGEAAAGHADPLAVVAAAAAQCASAERRAEQGGGAGCSDELRHWVSANLAARAGRPCASSSAAWLPTGLDPEPWAAARGGGSGDDVEGPGGGGGGGSGGGGGRRGGLSEDQARTARWLFGAALAARPGEGRSWLQFAAFENAQGELGDRIQPSKPLPAPRRLSGVKTLAEG